MAQPITLAAVKVHCKIAVSDTSEDSFLTALLAAAVATFEQLSKRSFAVTDNEDNAFLSENEVVIAGQWIRLTVAHWYENRQPEVVDVRVAVASVPHTVDFLMNLIRVPSI